MENELSTFDMIFGFDGTTRPTPPKLEAPAPPTSLDPVAEFAERASFIGEALRNGADAEAAASYFDHAATRQSKTTTEQTFQKRAPEEVIEKTATGWSIVRDSRGEISRAWAPGATDPKEFAA